MDENVLSAIEKLFDAVYKGASLQHIVDLAEDILNRPVIVHDASYRILSASAQYRIPPDAVEINNAFYLNEQAINTIHEKKQGLNQNEDAPVYLANVLDGQGVLACAIIINGTKTAFITVHENHLPFSDGDRLIVACLSKLLSLHLRQNEELTPERKMIPSHVFAPFFEGHNVAHEQYLLAHLPKAAWLHVSPFSLLTITDALPGIAPGKLIQIIQTLTVFFPLERCTVYHSSIIVFLDDYLKKKVLEDSRNDFEDFLKSISCHAGISNRFHQIQDLAKYYQQACKAAQFAVQTAKPYLYFADCGLLLLSELFSTHYDIDELIHPAIPTLVELDRETGTDYLATLKYYIYYIHTPNEAAKALHIHLNTLFYRINKIKEITGISFNTIEDAAKIYLSVQLLEINELISR